MATLAAGQRPFDAAVESLLDEGRVADAVALCDERLATSDAAAAGVLASCAEAARAHGDLDLALSRWQALAARRPDDWVTLEIAEAHGRLFHLDEALTYYEQVVDSSASPGSERRLVDFLLAMALFERAEGVLGEALPRLGEDPVLLEQRAVVAAARGRHEEAVRWLERSWDAGRERNAWLGRPRLIELATESPYREAVEVAALVDSLDSLEHDELLYRLRFLDRYGADSLTESAGRLVRFLAEQTDAEVLRLGLALFRGAATRSLQVLTLDTLLDAAEPRTRRAALDEIARELLAGDAEPRESRAWRSRLRQVLESERDAGNADLAEVLLAIAESSAEPLSRAAATIAAVPPGNSQRHLALHVLARRYAGAGRLAEAEQAQQAARSFRPVVQRAFEQRPDDALLSYWECVERTDLQEVRELLRHHRFVDRVDGRLYGLPANDFDDQKNLSIAERLFLRSWAAENGEAWPEDGPLQYPREIRHLLERMERENGTPVDCSGRLVASDEGGGLRGLVEDDSETKLQEDTSTDNEVHVVVNPYDPRYVVASSNPYDAGATGNEVYRSSDWGESWTHGFATVASNCCDPVSYYNRTDVEGVETDVLYHSTLVWPGPKTKLLYSTDNGATFSDCGSTIGTFRDRQDHVIDTNPASLCYNTIYVGHHGGTQYVAASTGETFPYCQSWNEQSTGIDGTLGSAMVVSTNGLAHDIFTQYALPGGVYLTTTSDCGASWSAAAKIANVTNAGDFEWGIPSTCGRQIYRYPQADSDRQVLSEYRNNLYVVWNDLSGDCTPPGCDGNTTCNNDIYLAIGTPDDRDDPSSWTWSVANVTDPTSDDYTDEFYPALTVDQADGAVYLSYYRTNSGSPGGPENIAPRKTQVHYVIRQSIDGGQSWSTPQQITDLPSDESGNGANMSMQWGDYTWNDVVEGVAYAAWTDRREGADEDIWASKLCSPPTHWSERAPTFTTPSTAVDPVSGNMHAVTWQAPDIYWGDGGEAPEERHFELWVDDVLAIDLIPADSTTVEWVAPDLESHSLRVRAVNQCGLSKDYEAALVSWDGVLFADDFESGTTESFSASVP